MKVEPRLEARGLEVHHGRSSLGRARVQALRGVDLTIGRGEVVGLVGPSGGGKSTLARALARLVEPTAGTIRFEGVDITRASARALRPLRRRLQMIFQDPAGALDPRQTVEDALTEALSFHEVVAGDQVESEVGQLLEQVGLRPEVRRRFPHQLSGGQRQRVALARALSVRPDLLIADEPTSALDVSVRAQVLNLFLDLRASRGLSVLLIAHDLAIVEHVADRVAVLAGGRIVEDLPAGALGSATHAETRALMEAQRQLQRALPERSVGR